MPIPPKKLSAEDRRAVTVEAVVELAAQQNPSDITTAAIAKHMNLTQGALFRHFADKESVWSAVMEWVAERLLRRIDAAAQGAASPLAALEAMFMAHVDFVIEHPGVPRMLFGELQKPHASPAKMMAQALIKRYRERLVTRLSAGRDGGQCSADLDVEAAAVLFVGSVQGLVMQSLLAGEIGQMRTVAPTVFQLYRRAVEARS